MSTLTSTEEIYYFYVCFRHPIHLDFSHSVINLDVENSSPKKRKAPPVYPVKTQKNSRVVSDDRMKQTKITEDTPDLHLHHKPGF